MSPRPQYFLVRPGSHTPPGLLVPLIPVDQLPAWLDLVDVPRELTAEQTVGLTNLGTVPRSDSPSGIFDVRVPLHMLELEPEPEPEFEAELHELQDRHTVEKEVRAEAPAGLAASMHADFLMSNPPPARTAQGLRSLRRHTPDAVAPHQLAPQQRRAQQVQYSGPYGSLEAASSIMLGSPPPPGPLAPTLIPTPAVATVANSSSSSSSGINNNTTPPPTISPGHASTTSLDTTDTTTTTSSSSPSSSSPGYCRHWCHFGTCRWGYHCRYAHAMPTTPAGFAEVGLTCFPEWWTAAMGLAGSAPPLAVRMALLGGGGGGRGLAPPGGAEQSKKQRKLTEWRRMRGVMAALGLEGAVGMHGHTKGPAQGLRLRDGPVPLHLQREAGRGAGAGVPGAKARSADSKGLVEFEAALAEDVRPHRPEADGDNGAGPVAAAASGVGAEIAAEKLPVVEKLVDI